MQKLLALFIVISLIAVHSNSQDKQEILKAFEDASLEFSVPVDILKGIAFVESRWSQTNWQEGNVSCLGIPPSFGIMGLRDDDWFGHSLIEAALLIDSSRDVLKSDYRENIRGAAALLEKYRRSAKSRVNTVVSVSLESWKDVLAMYSGIPQSDVAQYYAYDVLKRLNEGYHDAGIEIEKREINLNIFNKNVIQGVGAPSPQSDDYPPADWDPSPNYNSRGGSRITHFIIHDTEGSFSGAVSWLKNPDAQVSSHYVMRSSDGYVKQLVRESNRAWHAGCWNSWTIGIEHEGYVNNPAYFTENMYVSSAHLVRHASLKYGIPMDSLHIVGHDVWTKPWFPDLGWSSCNTHTDPGVNWDWIFYLQLVRQDPTPPNIVAYSPSSADSANLNARVQVDFSQRMEHTSTQAGFHISPNVIGSLTWQNNSKRMMFTPTRFLQAGTRYSVTIDTVARNFVNTQIDGDGDGVPDGNFSFMFNTVSYDNIAPRVEVAYPAKNQQNISTTVEFQVRFNEPIDQQTLVGNVLLLDSVGQSLPITVIKYSEVDGASLIRFSPASDLGYYLTYSVRLNSNVKDLFGNGLESDYVMTFRTEANTFVQGTVIEPFENIGGWKTPGYSGSTTGIDPNLTDFTVSSDRKHGGSSSGKLSYGFNGTNGVCREFDSSKPNIGSSQDQSIGAWIYGDGSNNWLEFWFYYNDTVNTTMAIGRIDWTGWKFKEISASLIQGTGDKLFHSFVLMQTSVGSKTGTIYFDDLQIRSDLTGVPGNGQSQMPQSYRLFQNYPNPFNPVTFIKFQIPEKNASAKSASATGSIVSLKVYDVLGREIKTLVEAEMPPGTYTAEFNAQRLASGVYFYKLHTDSYSEIKKMTVMK
jgi:N-acetyl-anhydromuramyl-L-alanine amidase AmpD